MEFYTKDTNIASDIYTVSFTYKVKTLTTFYTQYSKRGQHFANK